MRCESCGVELGVGDWPFCGSGHGKYGGTAVGDDIPGGFVQEMFGDKPEIFYSKKAMLKRADELNLRPRDQWAGPGDRYLSNWAAVSPKTLADAKAMLERVSGVTGDRRETLATAQFTVRKWSGDA